MLRCAYWRAAQSYSSIILHSRASSSEAPRLLKWIAPEPPKDSLPKLGGKYTEWGSAEEKKVWKLSRRIAKQVWRDTIEARAFYVLGASSGVVLAIGGVEGLLLVQDPSSLDGIFFAARYAWENLFTSCIWATKPSSTVALAMGHLPDADFLRSFDSSPSDAAMMLRLQGLETTRSLVAGWTLISQLVRIVFSSTHSMRKFKRRVMSGREPPFEPTGGRVIRLCGAYSFTTNVSLNRHGSHLLPVFEDPGRVSHLVSDDKRLEPVYWHVGSDMYGDKTAWSPLSLNHRWLLRGKGGRYLFLVEADITDPEDPLSLGHTAPGDMEFIDACIAFRVLMEEMRLKQSTSFRPFRVVLGDSMQVFESGGGSLTTVRERVLVQREADVLIDSRAVVLHELLKWCNRLPKQQGSGKKADRQLSAEHPKCICFDTNDEQYFKSMSKLLRVFGIRVLDVEAVDFRKEAALESQRRLPHLVYHRTTAETVNRLYTLSQAKAVDLTKTCVLVDQEQGVFDLAGMTKDNGRGFEVICTAHLFDRIFREVRVWARMGYNPIAIQAELDHEFGVELGAIYQLVSSR